MKHEYFQNSTYKSNVQTKLSEGVKKRKTCISRSNIKQSEKHIVYKLTGNESRYSELNMVQRTNIGTMN